MKPSKMHFKIYEQGVHRTKDLIDILPYAFRVTSMWCPNGGGGRKTMWQKIKKVLKSYDLKSFGSK